MSYVKRFTDFCAGFASFSALMFVLIGFLDYDFTSVSADVPPETMIEKLKYFFSFSPKVHYCFFLTLAILFAITTVVSIVFQKLPHLTLAVSILPLIQTVIMFDANMISTRPMLYIILGTAHVCGCLFECIRLDRRDKKRRAAFATDLLAYTIVAFCLYVLLTSGQLSTMEYKDLNIVEFMMYQLVKGKDVSLSIFIYVAICYAVMAIIRAFLKNLYYIDAILSTIPLALIILFWCTDKIPVFGSVLFLVAGVYAVSRIAIALTCKIALPNEE